MPAPKKEIVLQRKIEALEIELSAAKGAADHAKRLYENKLNEYSEQSKLLIQTRNERDDARMEGAKLCDQLNEQKRLNAIQDGYIQRVNEDEDRRDNHNSFRAGPIVSARLEDATMLSEHDHARRVR